MKKIINFFREGKFEEILGCIAIVVVIIPVIINIINRSIFNFYSIDLEVEFWFNPATNQSIRGQLILYGSSVNA